ncbi:MAG TPA: tRNA (pseudouridine(54)-N(1))-methyltransferase TrmY [Thermoplasmata archaeon]|nr:tRNA (pseudouridine(54)-N(1))-methyltransferase TrmY [Thermoplasmata archaeon]
MRRFLLLAHRVPVRGEFTLNDLAGGGGRMDEIARAVSTAFTLSNDLRRDTEVTILFAGAAPAEARRIDLIGARLRYLNPDERSTAALLKNALTRAAVYPHDFESSPGLRIGPCAPLEVLVEFLRRPAAVWLSEGGRPIASWAGPPGEIAAVVSDPYDPTPEETARLEASGVPRLSVGPLVLRTSQVIDAVHRELDLRGSGPAAPGSA